MIVYVNATVWYGFILQLVSKNLFVSWAFGHVFRIKYFTGQ